MNNLLKFIQSKWSLFFQLSMWIIGVAGTFLLTPPLLKYSGGSSVSGFTRFVIAGLIAIIFIPLRLRSAKKDYRFWYRTAVVGFFCCIISAACYAFLLGKWSVKFYDTRLVIGRTMTKEAAERKDLTAKLLGLPSIDDEKFVTTREGLTQYIWPEEELKSRFYVLTVLYVMCIVFVACFIIVVTQSIYCYEKKA